MYGIIFVKDSKGVVIVIIDDSVGWVFERGFGSVVCRFVDGKLNMSNS